MNLVTLADENLRNFGEYPFIIFEDATFTNRQMINQASGLADGLKSLGVKKGDNVVVMLPNCPEVLISYQGILRCGAVIVPLIPLVNEKELTHILGNCEATAMITTCDIFQKNESMLRTIKYHPRGRQHHGGNLSFLVTDQGSFRNTGPSGHRRRGFGSDPLYGGHHIDAQRSHPDA